MEDFTILMNELGIYDFHVQKNSNGRITLIIREDKYKDNLIQELNTLREKLNFSNIEFLKPSVNLVYMIAVEEGCINDANIDKSATNFKKYISIADMVYKNKLEKNEEK